ncbi:uncharacterized protein LOC135385411 isoform X2 [Ornithodoros turicata]
MTDAMETMRAQNPTITPPSIRIKNIPRNAETGTRFPKLGECAHFHYDQMDLATVQMSLVERSKTHEEADKENHRQTSEEGGGGMCCGWTVQVTSGDRCWTLRRTYDNFRLLDQQLHRCVYDRQFSKLPELPQEPPVGDVHDEEAVQKLLTDYLQRFSSLVGNLLNCGSVLNWLELDNRGNRLLVTDESAINTPAVAAAYVTKSYQAQAPDEISFEVGDMVSVIDMPPADESTWWRGKKGFEVGFFPSECVQVIGDKIPHNLKIPTKPVLRRHGKLIAFFRSFLLSRPSRRKLKQSGILRERVFGCDLGEHLTNTGRDVPLVLTSCAKFIEQYGIVDGIYRLSGVTSNIQKLRVTFDEDRVPDLNEDEIRQDIHCVASLLKMYFRDLPNPLLTYQLYDKFVAAMQLQGTNRLQRIREVVKELPPPHYRTLEALIRHLSTVSDHGNRTGMTARNVAIVWAPNLLRSKDLEVASVGVLKVIGVQAVLTEYLICYVDLIFNDKMPAYPSSPESQQSTPRRNSRPKSLAISTPTKLLSLEEAQSRALASNLPGSQPQKYIDVGGGPENLPAKYHTVIDLPLGKRGSGKLKKSPLGWKSFFVRGWHSGSTREKDKHSPGLRKTSAGSLPHHQSLPTQDKALTESDMVHSASRQLRSVKSAESLVSSTERSCRNSDTLDSCNSSSDASRVQPFQWLPETTPTTSPSGHKHVRSVSHDSYFERGGNGGLDLSLDDLSATYDLVAQQAAQSPTSPPQKSPRKQKLSSDVECANPKVQRLSDCAESSETLRQSKHAGSIEMQADEPALSCAFPAEADINKVEPVHRLSSDDHSEKSQPASRSLTPFSSRQPLAVHSPDDIGPYQSPSPQEHVQMSCQYRNALDAKQQAGEKTVLVEVHATQEDYITYRDCRSSEEQNMGQSQNESDSDATEGDLSPHLGCTSLAEDIASSLKMSNSEINTDFLVGAVDKREDAANVLDQADLPFVPHETSFLNRLSAVLPYIEDTDTSPSAVSSPCALVTASARSTPHYVEEFEELPFTKEEMCTSPMTEMSSVIDRDVSFNSPAPDGENCSVNLTSEIARTPEHTNVNDRDNVELLLNNLKEQGGSLPSVCHDEQDSTSEDEGNDTMPYAYLDESPMVETLSHSLSPLPHSQSQDQNICLLSPADTSRDTDSLPVIVSVAAKQPSSPEALVTVDGQHCPHNVEESCVMQVEALNHVIKQEVLNEIHDDVQNGEKFMELDESVVNETTSNRPVSYHDKFVQDHPEVPVERGDITDTAERNLQLSSSPHELQSHLTENEHLERGTSKGLVESRGHPEAHELPLDVNTQSSRDSSPSFTAAELEDIENSTELSVVQTSPAKEEVQLRSTSSVVSCGQTSQSELKRKSEPQPSSHTKDLLCKRLSEPAACHPCRERKGSVKELTSKFEGSDTNSVPSADSSPSKGSQPSLFTQLKVMRLMRNNPSPPSATLTYDPWSDPILDSTVDSSVYDETVPVKPGEVHQTEPIVQEGKKVTESVDGTKKVEDKIAQVNRNKRFSAGVTNRQQGTGGITAAETAEPQRPISLDLMKVNAPMQNEVTETSKGKKSTTSPHIDSETRRRIEKIKEERRAQLREKLKSESFRTDDRPDATKQRKTSEGGPDTEKTEKSTVGVSSRWSRHIPDGNHQADTKGAGTGMTKHAAPFKGAESRKGLPKGNESSKASIRKSDGPVWAKQAEQSSPLAPAAQHTTQAGRLWEKQTTQAGKAKTADWSRAPKEHQLTGRAASKQGGETQGSILASSKPPVPKTTGKDSDAVSRKEDLSPPKRIRDRAAMFECRNQKEQHAPHRITRTDLPSC